MDSTKKFKSAIEKILKKMNRNLKLNERSTALISRLLSGFLNKIGNGLLEQGAHTGVEISLTDIRNALEKYFSENMTKHAVINGNKFLSLYREGSIKYCPSKSSAKSINAVCYEKGIKGILMKINSKLVLNERSSKLLDNILNLLITKMINGLLGKKANEVDKIFPIDVQNELSREFSGKSINSAIAEGSKALFMYQSGLIKYRSEQSVERVVNYEKGINEVLNSINKNLKFKQNSWLLLAKALNILTMKTFHSLSEENVDKVISLTTLTNALSKRLPENIMRHATSEGTKAVLLYESGVNIYERKKSELFAKKSTFFDNIPVAVNSFIRNMYGSFNFDATVGKEISVFLEKLFSAILATIRNRKSTTGSISLFEVSRSINEVFGESLAPFAESEGMKAVALANCDILMESEKVVSIKKLKTKDKRSQIVSKASRKSRKKVDVKGRKKNKTKSVISKSSATCKTSGTSYPTVKEKPTRLISRRKSKLIVGRKIKRIIRKRPVKKPPVLGKRPLKKTESKRYLTSRKTLQKQSSKKKILKKLPKKKQMSPKLPSKTRISKKLPKRKQISELPNMERKLSRKRKIASELPSKKLSKKLLNKKIILKKLPSKKKISKKLSQRKTPIKRKRSTKILSKTKASTKRLKKRKIATPQSKKKISRKLISTKKTSTKQALKRKILKSSTKTTKKTCLKTSLKETIDSSEIIFRPQLDFVAGEMKISFDKIAFSKICLKLMLIARNIAIEAQKQTPKSLDHVSIVSALKIIFPGSILRHAEAEGHQALCNVINNVHK